MAATSADFHRGAYADSATTSTTYAVSNAYADFDRQSDSCSHTGAPVAPHSFRAEL